MIMADVKADRKVNESTERKVVERENGRAPAEGNGMGVNAATDTGTRDAASDLEAEHEAHESNEAFDEPAAAPPKRKPLYKRPVFLVVALVVVVFAAVFGLRYWLY